MESITEEMGLQNGWYEEAKAMTPDKLTEFIDKMMNNYNHDYGCDRQCHQSEPTRRDYWLPGELHHVGVLAPLQPHRRPCPPRAVRRYALSAI